MVTTGMLPIQGKIPILELGIEPGTSWLVVRSSDHQTTRLVLSKMGKYAVPLLFRFDLGYRMAPDGACRFHPELLPDKTQL